MRLKHVVKVETQFPLTSVETPLVARSILRTAWLSLSATKSVPALSAARPASV
jgi:hypothetical protein